MHFEIKDLEDSKLELLLTASLLHKWLDDIKGNGETNESCEGQVSCELKDSISYGVGGEGQELPKPNSVPSSPESKGKSLGIPMASLMHHVCMERTVKRSTAQTCPM